jgi:hypothetical protein
MAAHPSDKNRPRSNLYRLVKDAELNASKMESSRFARRSQRFQSRIQWILVQNSMLLNLNSVAPEQKPVDSAAESSEFWR